MIANVEHTQLIPVLVCEGVQVGPGDYLACVPQLVELDGAVAIQGLGVRTVCGDLDDATRAAEGCDGGVVVACTVPTTGGALIAHRARDHSPTELRTVAACPADGIAAEQALTAGLREAADLVIDTSDLPTPELRRLIERRYGPEAQFDTHSGLAVSLISFAFPAGLPRESDMVFDARFLRNPHYVEALRPRTGKDPAVGAYVEEDPDYRGFFDGLTGLLGMVLPRFVQEGKKYATIAVGCTGGRHRSVYLVERLASHLTQAGWRVTLTHRELLREEALLAQPQAPDGSVPAATPRPSVQAQEA